MISNYIFPFNTCEAVATSFPLQPWSFIVNLASSMMLVCMALSACRKPVRNLILMFALFELYHAASHAIHLQHMRYVIHFIVYGMTYTLILAMRSLIGYVPKLTIVLVSYTVVIDLSVVIATGGTGLAMIFSGLSIMAMAVLSFINEMPSDIARMFVSVMSGGLGVLFLLFANESFNCEWMLNTKVFPYHAIIEVWGLILFALFSGIFLLWEQFVILRV